MKLHSLRLLAISTASLIAACGVGPKPGPTGPGVEIAVAPLSLPNTLGVEYAVAVFNDEPGDNTQIFDATGAVLSGNDAVLVWQQASVTSNRFGNGEGGAISYIGPCDASLGGDSINYVALALEQVYVGANNGSENAVGPFALAPFDATMSVLDDQNTANAGTLPNDGDPDFENPCPFDDPCLLPFPCEENRDTRVVFNLTVMRDADQGFFDVAVNFDDVFCSAKFDTCYAGDTPIELLFGDDTDTDTANASGDTLGDEPGRDRTGVFAMACTAGPKDGVVTDILMGEVTVTCGAVSFALPISGLTQSAGNQEVSVDVNADGALDDVQYAIYHGAEDLRCDPPGTGCNKAYLNVAINLEDLPAGCTLSLDASAQDAAAPTFQAGALAIAAGSGTSYPFIGVTAADLDTDTCVRDQLDDGGSVATYYGSSFIGGDTPALLCDHSTSGAAPVATPGATSALVSGTDLVATLNSTVTPAIVDGQLTFSVALTNSGSDSVRLGLLWHEGYRYFDAAVWQPDTEACGVFAGLAVSDNSSLALGQTRTVQVTAGRWHTALPEAVQLVFFDDSDNTIAVDLTLGDAPSIPTATVSGIIYTDTNANGTYEVGTDSPISGATLTFSPDLADPFANLLYIAPPWTGTSDASGQISIDGVATGTPLCKTLSASGYQTTTQCGLVIGAPDSGDEVFAPGFAMRGTCTVVTPSTDATCDGIDDDCDGSIDEDADPLACDPCLTNSDCCSGACTTGVCTGAPVSHVVSSLTVQGPADLPADYECITEVTGALTIDPNPSNGTMPLMNFASLQSAGEAYFYTSTAWDVAHFPVLTSVTGAMQVYGLGGDSFLSVPALASIGGPLDIFGEGLDLAFSSLSTCGDIAVLDLYAWRGDLLDISFPALQTGSGISVYTATSTSLVSFPALTSATSFVLESHTAHPDAVHIPLLTSLSGTLQLVDGNGVSPPNLWTNLSKFAALTTVGTLIVRDNGALAALSLTGLTSVTSYFDVSNNPALDNCLVEALWDGLTTRPASPTVSGNLGTCPLPW